jgi:hypothetical protein
VATGFINGMCTNMCLKHVEKEWDAHKCTIIGAMLYNYSAIIYYTSISAVSLYK